MNFVLKENSSLGEKYYYGKHSTGLEIFVIPKEHKQSFAIFGTRYGAMDRTFKTDEEAEFVTVPDGIAHFLEHKMFENEDGVDTFSRYAENGADANAFTSNEMTAYLFSSTEHYYENLEILLDFVTHPYFTKETVEKEQGIIGQEITMYDDSPNWSLYQNLLSALYRENYVKIDVAGTVESIAEITPEILYRCYDTFYNLNNMTLVVCGRFDCDRVAALCDRVLKPSKDVHVESRQPKEPRDIVKDEVRESFPVAGPMFMIGLKETDLPEGESGEDKLKRSCEQEIVADMLFGRASDFYYELYNEGLLNEKFDVGYELGKNYSHLIISGESSNPRAVFEAAKRTVEKVKQEGFEPADFRRCKKARYARSIAGWNNTSDISERFLNLRFVGCDMLTEPDVISSVTAEDIAARLEKSFDTKLMALSVVEPIEKE